MGAPKFMVGAPKFRVGAPNFRVGAQKFWVGAPEFGIGPLIFEIKKKKICRFLFTQTFKSYKTNCILITTLINV